MKLIAATNKFVIDLTWLDLITVCNLWGLSRWIETSNQYTSSTSNRWVSSGYHSRSTVRALPSGYREHYPRLPLVPINTFYVANKKRFVGYVKVSLIALPIYAVILIKIALVCVDFLWFHFLIVKQSFNKENHI